SGGTVWLDPAIRSTYFARATLPSLAKQYARYGFWKVRMLRRYPETIRLRQAIPPVFVLSLLTLAVLAVWLPLVGWLLGLEVVLYGLALMAVGIQTAVNRRSFSLLFGVPLAIITMHFFWGGAFLWSIVQFKAKTTVR
ncbi:MAG: glycosyltransferase family 2 protein, partial [Anaerolineae bacterium]|nr:glycosyltransferase family 2 protein [Anaerolineae bacterium]